MLSADDLHTYSMMFALFAASERLGLFVLAAAQSDNLQVAALAMSYQVSLPFG